MYKLLLLMAARTQKSGKEVRRMKPRRVRIAQTLGAKEIDTLKSRLDDVSEEMRKLAREMGKPAEKSEVANKPLVKKIRKK